MSVVNTKYIDLTDNMWSCRSPLNWRERGEYLILMLYTELYQCWIVGIHDKKWRLPADLHPNEGRLAAFIFSDKCMDTKDVRTGPLRWIRPQVAVGSSNVARILLLEPRFRIRADIQNVPKIAKMAEFTNVSNDHFIIVHVGSAIADNCYFHKSWTLFGVQM